MLQKIESIIGLSIGATDGEIGKVKDIYFDDETWDVRYLVVETGTWLFGRKVLISPVAIQPSDWSSETLPVNLTQEQIKNSPDIDTERPVSKEQESDLYNYYSWPAYGGAGMGYMTTGMVGGVIAPGANIDDKTPEETHQEDNHLRSIKNIADFQVYTQDGLAGDIDDFFIDNESWNINHLIIKTGDWYSNKKIVLSTKKAGQINWKSADLHISIGTEALVNNPVMEDGQTLNANYERSLDDFHSSNNQY